MRYSQLFDCNESCVCKAFWASRVKLERTNLFPVMKPGEMECCWISFNEGMRDNLRREKAGERERERESVCITEPSRKQSLSFLSISIPILVLLPFLTYTARLQTCSLASEMAQMRLRPSARRSGEAISALDQSTSGRRVSSRYFRPPLHLRYKRNETKLNCNRSID